MSRIIFIVLIVFVCSCARNSGSKQADSANKLRQIHLVSAPDSIITNISDIASDVQYIPLQKTANSKIKAIDKILVTKNMIYVNLVNELLCFDNEGHFLCSLTGSGKANRGRFDVIYDFDVSSGDSTLLVLSSDKILKFKNTGTKFMYLKSIDPGKRAPSKLTIVPGTDNILLSFIRAYGTEPTLNALIDNNGEILFFKPNNFKRLNSIQSGSSYEIINYKFDMSLYFKERYNDTVYSVGNNSDSFNPEIILDSRLSTTTSKNLDDPEYKKILPRLLQIFETHRYLYYSYLFNTPDISIFSIPSRVFYDKFKNKKYQIEPVKGVLKDDIGGGPDFDPKFCSEGEMYSWISATELKQYLGSKEFSEAKVLNPRKHDDLKKLALSLKDGDNPILVLVKLKN